ncbi:subtilisin-like protein [Lactarius sanguifluus]|nr:subtilisin-like protein [Lactarius sanguifluus]
MHHCWLSVLSVLSPGPLGGLAMSLTPRWGDMHTKHMWAAVPEHWESMGHPSVGAMIDLRIALKPDRENALVDTLYEVSSPQHQRHLLLYCRYGAHLSKEQVADLVAPHQDTRKIVESWLEHHGVPPSNVSTSHGGGWLTVTGVPVSKANDLLGASYQHYRHTGTNETILRTVRYALPTALHGLVKTVAPTTFFGSPRTLRQTSRKRSGGRTAPPSRRDGTDDENDEALTPSYLRSLYKTVTYQPAALDMSVLGITGFHDQYPSAEDLTLFMTLHRSDAVDPDPTFTVIGVNGGGYDPEDPGHEANLDMQYAQGMAWPIRHIFYSIGGLPDSDSFIPDSNQPENNNEPFLEWLEYMINQDDIPQTITTSYGGDEQTFPVDYAESVCELFAQLGVRGVSVLFASGDLGVGGGDCQKNDGSGTVEFLPIFPPTCPYVTSVGSTRDIPEVAADFSSGGFSNYFKRPRYQTDAVPPFLQQLGGQYTGLYNASSRGFPDISAQGVDFEIVLGGELEDEIFGTSGSAPIVAGIISMLSDYRLATNRPPLGFLNPWLYGRALRLQGINDITSGSNPGCDTDGFSAVDGWDPVTGLGTLDFEALLNIVAAD